MEEINDLLNLYEKRDKEHPKACALSSLKVEEFEYAKTLFKKYGIKQEEVVGKKRHEIMAIFSSKKDKALDDEAEKYSSDDEAEKYSSLEEKLFDSYKSILKLQELSGVLQEKIESLIDGEKLQENEIIRLIVLKFQNNPVFDLSENETSNIALTFNDLYASFQKDQGRNCNPIEKNVLIFRAHLLNKIDNFNILLQDIDSLKQGNESNKLIKYISMLGKKEDLIISWNKKLITQYQERLELYKQKYVNSALKAEVIVLQILQVLLWIGSYMCISTTFTIIILSVYILRALILTYLGSEYFSDGKDQISLKIANNLQLFGVYLSETIFLIAISYFAIVNFSQEYMIGFNIFYSIIGIYASIIILDIAFTVVREILLKSGQEYINHRQKYFEDFQNGIKEENCWTQWLNPRFLINKVYILIGRIIFSDLNSGFRHDYLKSERTGIAEEDMPQDREEEIAGKDMSQKKKEMSEEKTGVYALVSWDVLQSGQEIHEVLSLLPASKLVF